MSDIPIAVTVSSGEAGWTPTAFLSVVEYVDPDGNPGVTVIASNGCTEARQERLRAAVGV